MPATLLRLTSFLLYVYDTLFSLFLLTLHLPRANDALAEKNEQQQDHRRALHLDVGVKLGYTSARNDVDIRYLCNLKSDRDSSTRLEKRFPRRRKSSLCTIKRGEYINGAKTHPFIRGCSFCSRGREHSFRWHASDSYFIVPSGALSSSNVARPWGKSLEIAFRAKHVRRQLDWSRFGIRTFPSRSISTTIYREPDILEVTSNSKEDIHIKHSEKKYICSKLILHFLNANYFIFIPESIRT